MASTMTTSRSLPEGIGVEGAGDRLEADGDAGPGPGDRSYGDRLQAALPDRLQAACGRVLPQLRERDAAVGGGEVDARVEAREVGERKRTRPRALAGHALA